MKLIKLIIGLLLVLGNTECSYGQNSNNKHQTESKKGFNIQELLTSEQIDSSKIFTIQEDCVFVIQMSTQESDLIEKENPDYYESFSENANIDATVAQELLDKLKIKNYWSDKQYIRFTFENQEKVIDTRAKKIAGEYCIIFEKDTYPLLCRIDQLNEETFHKLKKK